MNASRKRTYLIVMGLGATALLIDRLILPAPVTEPVEVLARPVPRQTAKAAPGAERPGQTSLIAASIPEVPFPRNLPPSDEVFLRDLFAPVLVDDMGNILAPDSETTSAPRPGRLLAKDFIAAHKLEAVMTRDQVRIILINGSMLRVDDELDGCRLQEISGDAAHFGCEDGGAILKLSNPLEKKSD